ncbi:MAG TPA: RluA family pseudouridine synthase [Candidatus Saccharimonadales bacterium]
MRLDAYCAQAWPEHSRSSWQKLIEQGNVTVNGEVITSPKHEVRENDSVDALEVKAPDFSGQTLPVIFEDENVIVINKPVGVLTHAKGALNEEFTVAEFFRAKTSYNTETNRPGIIHRLDRDTSGILIGAKNSETARLLSKQFQDRKAKKTYVAIVDGEPKEPKALLDLPIGRNPKAPSTFRVDPNGKSAETTYELIKSSRNRSMIKLMPRTGRTHQLRVHMAYLNTPIRGDRVYGKSAKRLFLHAWKLEITIPDSKRITFTAPLPVEFEQELEA